MKIKVQGNKWIDHLGATVATFATEDVAQRVWEIVSMSNTDMDDILEMVYE